MSSNKGRKLQGRVRCRFDEADRPLLGKLKPVHRTALETVGSYEEAAVELGVPIGTVKSRLNRARAALEALKEERNDGSGSSI